MVNGLMEMKARLADLNRRTRQAVLNGILKYEQEELAEMKRRTPVDTGELRDSGQALQPVYDESTRTFNGEIIFDAPYAVYVHEDLEAFHPIGQAKFMESVLNESRRYFAARVAAHVKREVGL